MEGPADESGLLIFSIFVLCGGCPWHPTFHTREAARPTECGPGGAETLYMPVINVVFWNIQNFGTTPAYKANYVPLCQFVAEVARLVQADIICIQELKAGAVAGAQPLYLLHQALCSLPAPGNNWYVDWVKGSIVNAGGAAPWATSGHLDWDAAHHEGYALFWNQNLAKFKMDLAAPLMPPPPGAGVAKLSRLVGVFSNLRERIWS